MRHYLVRLLAERYDVRAVPDGQAALDAVRKRRPDLILSDVMMPQLDGFGLLRELRLNAGTNTIPVILLSARASEESRVEGMEHGADDYLIKPFSARELLARVQTHLELGRVRKHAEEALRQRTAQFETLLDVAPLGVYLVDADLCILHMNPPARHSFGDISDVTGRRLDDVIHILWPSPYADEMAQHFRHTLETGEPYVVSEQIQNRADGGAREIYEWQINRIPLPGGRDGVVCYFRDISRFVEAREAMAESTAKFRAVFEQSSVFAGILTTDGILIDANRLCLEVCGYRLDEVLGQPFWETGWWRGSPEAREKIRAGTMQAAQGQPYREELAYRWADGTERLVEFGLYPILDSQGKVIFLHPTGIDVTDRKEAERTTGLLAAIVDSSDDAIVSKKLDGIITSWNKSAERLFRYKADEAIGQHITLIVPPDRQSEERMILEKIRRGERIDHFETIRVRKDGSTIDISLTISPVNDRDGRVIGASKTARDISERKHAERALRESEERFRAIVETTPECVKLVNFDGVLLHINSSGLKMIGADRLEAVVGNNMYNLIAPKDRDRFRTFNEAICRGEKGSLDFDIVGLQGTLRHMETHAAPFRMPDGTVAQLAVTRDITERARAGEALRKSEERLRQLSETLEAEVHVRTGELEARNADILRQSEQLRDLSWRLLRTQDDERRYIARELHDSAGQTLTVLGMTLARLVEEAKRNAPQLAEVVEETQNLVQHLNQEIRTTSYLLHPPLLDESGLSEALGLYVQGLAERSGMEITLDIPEDFGRIPREMELVIFRIVQESLTNVHRHSDSNVALIRIGRSDENVSVQVQDHGKGIPLEKLAKIQTQGTGVGIRGMRERVLQFGGNMSIQSDESGTLISIALPLV
jgi:PAS domain S-box-containing protein